MTQEFRERIVSAITANPRLCTNNIVHENISIDFIYDRLSQSMCEDLAQICDKNYALFAITPCLRPQIKVEIWDRTIVKKTDSGNA